MQVCSHILTGSYAASTCYSTLKIGVLALTKGREPEQSVDPITLKNVFHYLLKNEQIITPMFVRVHIAQFPEPNVDMVLGFLHANKTLNF